MCRCEATMSRAVAVRGMTRNEGSPHHGLARSPSVSDGGSLFMESAAVVTSATVASDNAHRSGLHGIGSVEPEPRAISMRAIAVDVGLRYLKESITLGPLYRGVGSPTGSESRQDQVRRACRRRRRPQRPGASPARRSCG